MALTLLYTQDIELCVSNDNRELATKILEAQDAIYKRLPDLQVPDFYHQYKKHPHRFQVCDSKAGLELCVVTDQALGLDLTDQTVVSNVYCGIAVSIRYPTYKALLEGWLNLASAAMKVENFSFEVVYTMQAERLIDAQDVDEAWFKEHLSHPDHYLHASSLLSGPTAIMLDRLCFSPYDKNEVCEQFKKSAASRSAALWTRWPHRA
ncbi:hypothetical protein EJ03DRAFT_378585 [Teratosphaeria nubilosa]|uniref:Uncharacterized protein n=1 Tax=Teratosphaeria nubilosa TaxID=161662 RepID=A0A6G1KWC2_9PEZI|nr:hypothetical protein EJ03DRAFT_378585 [Teratosphaeria nubilosa]